MEKETKIEEALKNSNHFMDMLIMRLKHYDLHECNQVQNAEWQIKKNTELINQSTNQSKVEESPKAEEGEESKILKGFINRISKNKQLDAETQKILNETYWDLLDDNQTNRKSRTVEQIEIPTWIECSKLLTDQEKLTPLHQFIYTYGNDSRLWKNYFERAIKHLNK